MIYRAAADTVLVLHFCFVLFAVFGGLLALRRRAFLYLHLPALAWSVVVELFQLSCPLTFLENYFRSLGGESGYAGGFIEHYVSLLLYPAITPRLQIALGILLLIFNSFVYAVILSRLRSGEQFRFSKTKQFGGE